MKAGTKELRRVAAVFAQRISLNPETEFCFAGILGLG